MPVVDLTTGTASLVIRPERHYGPARGQASAREMELDRDDREETGRQRIIERPRLTRLLDESPSRILMLIAPAGYGKTTLARQWLRARRHGWYRGSSASADVAAVAVGLARCVQEIAPGAGDRMEERLRATGTPEEDVVALAELLAEDLQEWPEDAWLVFDDYQFACRSRFSERFVDLLVALTKVRFLLTSRVRPSWATSRRLLYGELHEVGRTFLAMTDEEALEVLGDEERASAPGLVALAEGWPAVIGLASLTEGRDVPDEAVPSTLYDYFAEELYQAASPELQWQLCQLALVPTVTEGLAESLLGREAARVLDAGSRLGFFTSPARGVYDTHPLLRTFLESKFREEPDEQTTPATSKLAHALADRELWDDAFDVVERFFGESLYLELLELALPSVLRDGRLPTLDRWVEVGVARGVDAAVLNLAEAEISFRKGEPAQAEALALRANKRMEPAEPLRVRALLLAGSSAHINNRDEQAFAYHVQAYEEARNDADRWDALRGQVVAATILERPDTELLLEALASLNDGTVERESSLRVVQFHFNSRLGSVAGESRHLEEFVFVAPRIRNPALRSNLYYQLVQAHLHEARYRDALKVIAQITPIAREHRLFFIRPYLTLLRARAEVGLRNFSRAVRLVDGLFTQATKSHHDYLALESLLLKARILMSEGQPERALETLEAVPRFKPPRGEYGEYLTGRALALACVGELDSARELVSSAMVSTRSLPVQTLGPCVLAIAATQEGSSDAEPLVERAVEVVQSSGEIDSFVSAYRSYPALLGAVAEIQRVRDWLLTVLVNARDTQLAKRFTLKPSRRQSGDFDLLSARECEVLDLVAQGLTNRQIAKALYISESTTKVHLRHIYEKLAVRTRVEAAMKVNANALHATAANDAE